MAVNDPAAFGSIVEKVKAQLSLTSRAAGQPGTCRRQLFEGRHLVGGLFSVFAQTMTELEQLVGSCARRISPRRPTPAELENAKARYLGKSRSRDRAAEGPGQRCRRMQKKAQRRARSTRLKVQQVEAAADRARRDSAGRRRAGTPSCSAEALDVTLPGRRRGTGGLHPVSRTMERIEAIFGSDGLRGRRWSRRSRPTGMSFTALNNPENHPARSMQDTFYVDLKDAARPLAEPAPAHQSDAGALCAAPTPRAMRA